MIPAVSFTGSVLGMAQTAVKPPAAAARVPVAIVSLSSRPGSRRWVWMSMKPGQTTRPFSSRTWAPRGWTRGPTSSMTPSEIIDVERRVETLGGVDHPPALQQQPAHDEASALPPRSRYRTAIRTATPFVTWSRMTE